MRCQCCFCFSVLVLELGYCEVNPNRSLHLVTLPSDVNRDIAVGVRDRSLIHSNGTSRSPVCDEKGASEMDCPWVLVFSEASGFGGSRFESRF